MNYDKSKINKWLYDLSRNSESLIHLMGTCLF